MKKFVTNSFATTGISLLLLSVTASLFHAECLYLRTVFQVFGANIIVHTGLYFLRKVEMKNAMAEMVFEILLIISILLVFGEVFQWFASIPVWILIVMGVIMYAVSVLLDLSYMRPEARKINTLIKEYQKTHAKAEYIG